MIFIGDQALKETHIYIVKALKLWRNRFVFNIISELKNAYHKKTSILKRAEFFLILSGALTSHPCHPPESATAAGKFQMARWRQQLPQFFPRFSSSERYFIVITKVLPTSWKRNLDYLRIWKFKLERKLSSEETCHSFCYCHITRYCFVVNLENRYCFLYKVPKLTEHNKYRYIWNHRNVH